MTQILKGLSYDEYAALPAVRYSDLKHFSRSALHARYAMLNPKDDTPSTVIGSALHACVLEPKAFLEGYAVAPKLDKRTKEGKQAWSEFEASNVNAICLRQDEFDLVRGMADALCGHPFIQAALQDLRSFREAVILWDESVDGLSVSCKARIDWIVGLGGRTYVIDLKSARDAGQNEFARAINTFKYHGQAASYLRALQAAAPTSGVRTWLWAVVENSAPYGVALYEPSEGLLEQGLQDYLGAIRQYSQARATNQWPGYPEVITPIDLPRWAWRETEVTV